MMILHETKAKDRLALADVDDRAKEKQTKKEKRLEKKMKEKERKRAILEGKMKNIKDEDEEAEDEDQEVDFNPETKSFLDALTLPGGESESDDDRKSYYIQFIRFLVTSTPLRQLAVSHKSATSVLGVHTLELRK